MAFGGWLLEINGKMFLTRLIAVEFLRIILDQIMGLDPYRDADGVPHWTAPPHTAALIEFTTTALYLKDVEIFNSSSPHDNRARCQVEYWNPNTSSYASGAFYIADVPHELYMVDEEKNGILCKLIKVTPTEY